MASNFDNHKFQNTSVDDLVKQGLIIGAKVVLTRRFTVDFDKARPDRRRDFGVGTETFIKGYADGKVVCRFEAEFGNGKKTKVFESDAAIKASNVSLPSAYAGVAKAPHWHKLFTTYPFLKELDNDSEIEVVDDSDNCLMHRDVSVQSMNIRSHIMCTVNTISELVRCGDNSILIVKQNNAYQLWTLVDFKAGSLVLVPETTELKPRFYTVGEGRSVVCKNVTDPSMDKRPFVMDGRARAAPHSKSSCALFWMVERTDENKKVNLVAKQAQTSIKTTVVIGDKTYEQACGHSQMPGIPVLVNEKKISKHTRLFAKTDSEVQQLCDKQMAADLKRKSAEEKKAKAGDSKDDDKPAKKAKADKQAS